MAGPGASEVDAEDSGRGRGRGLKRGRGWLGRQASDDDGSTKHLAGKWSKEWVPQKTVLNDGKCLLFKWVPVNQKADASNSLIDNTKQAEPHGENSKAEVEEHEIVYLCSFDGCGRVFRDLPSLRKHAQVHRDGGKLQYICNYEGCGKGFTDSSKLKRHNLVHTGEKNFVCPFEGCGKAFSLPFNMRTHLRSHTGENYHSCPVQGCPKRYALEYKLKIHMRTHHACA